MHTWARALPGLQLPTISERVRTMTGEIKDPYDNFDLHLELAGRSGTGLIYFILLGDYGKYDKMLSYKNKRFRDLVKKLDEKAGSILHMPVLTNRNK